MHRLFSWLSPWSSRHASGEDDTARALRDIERQGAHLATLAHLCAGVLIFLFSLGSLISLSAQAFTTVLASWDRGALDIPAAISVGVSTLLVLAMDTAMLYAASVLRVLAVRGASGNEAAIHRVVLISAALLEAATYTYMSWLYDRPETLALWALVLARALAAPLYAVYLSMARPLPVGPRDIFAQAELASGRGVLRDVTALANDPSAPLDKKLRIMGAASAMADRDRSRLAALISAVTDGASGGPDIYRLDSGPALLDAPALAAVGVFTPTAPDRGPTGGPDDGPSSPTGGPTGGNGGKRQGSRGSSRGGASSSTAGGVLRLVSDTPRRDSRRDSGMTRAQQEALYQRDMAQAREILAGEPIISTRELARRLTVGRAYTCHPGRAATIRRALATEATEAPDGQARASV